MIIFLSNAKKNEKVKVRSVAGGRRPRRRKKKKGKNRRTGGFPSEKDNHSRIIGLTLTFLVNSLPTIEKRRRNEMRSQTTFKYDTEEIVNMS